MLNQTDQTDQITYDEIRDFLHTEAEYLDDYRFADWLKLMDGQIRYFVPVRYVADARGGRGFSEEMGHIDDDFLALESRVMRMSSPYAWAESPPSRIRHLITNIRLQTRFEGQDAYPSGTVKVKSNVLIYRSCSDEEKSYSLTAERIDLLRRADDGGLRLLNRRVELDQATIGTHNISFLF